MQVQVRVKLPVPGQVPGVEESRKVSFGAGSQLSVQVGAVKLGVAGHSIVFGPAHVITGGVVSTTWNVCWQGELFPHELVSV